MRKVNFMQVEGSLMFGNTFKYMIKAMKFSFEDSPQRYVTIIILLLINALIPIIVLNTTKHIISELMNFTMDGTEIVFLLALYLLFQYLGSLKTIINAIGSYIWISTEIVLQKKLLHKIQEMPLISYDSELLYNKVVLAQKSYNNALQASMLAIVAFFLTTATFVGILSYIALIDVSLIVAVVILTIPQLISKKFEIRYHIEERVKTASAKIKRDKYINCIVDKNYNRDSRVQMYQEKIYKLWKNENIFVAEMEERTLSKIQIQNIITTVISSLGYILAILYVFKKFIDFKINAAEVVVVMMGMEYLMMFFNVAFEQIGNVFKQASLSEDMFKFLDLELEKEKEKIETSSDNYISGENISFKYPNSDEYALKNLNFKINNGERIAIVGSNGSGKTTLSKIIANLYEPTSGKVVYPNIYVENEKVKSSVVFQDYKKYFMSLIDNITFGLGNNHLEKIKEALEKSGFCHSLSNNEISISQKLGKEFDGMELSEGQWQLLAIARGLYHLENLLILDEPTSAIDPIAELKLYERIMKVSKGITSIFITHRLAFAKYADNVWYMENGKIVEMGTHVELMKLNKKYAEMYKEQAQWYRT